GPTRRSARRNSLLGRARRGPSTRRVSPPRLGNATPQTVTIVSTLTVRAGTVGVIRIRYVADTSTYLKFIQPWHQPCTGGPPRRRGALGQPGVSGLPRRSRTGAHMSTAWIYIRSSAYASLPAPGTRVDPGDAGVMPKIVSPNTTPALQTAFAAHHYRFVGIEIATTFAVRTGTHSNVILLGYDANGNGATTTAQLPHDITFDRCYVHGTTTGNVIRGLADNGAAIAVADSYFADFRSTGNDTPDDAGW